MSKYVYVVREGMTGGYLPDSLTFFARKREAQAYMVDRANQLRDEDMRVLGSARKGWYDYTPRDASEYHLGNSIALNTVNSNMYGVNIQDEDFSTIDDLVQYLNDHYA
jgi:hypothetical protein